MAPYDVCLTSLNVMLSRSVHAAANGIIMERVRACVCTQTPPGCLYPLLSVDTQLLPFLAVVSGADVNAGLRVSS